MTDYAALDLASSAPLVHDYDVTHWKILNDQNLIQCFCSKVLTKASPKADVMSCKDCGLSVSLKAISALFKEQVLLKPPLIRLPTCKTCHSIGVRMYDVDKKKVEFGKRLCIVCACTPKPHYFSPDDGNDACWGSYVDTEKAGRMMATAMRGSGGVSAPIIVRSKPRDMFVAE